MVAAVIGGAARQGRRQVAGWVAGWLLVLWSWLLAANGCGSAPSPSPIAAWAEGPVRWLLLPEEQRQLRRLRGHREAVLFIEFFWRRRDPTSEDRRNPFLPTFHDRVQAADELYAGEGVRGALTDRGRALILLGAPPVLRQRVRTVLVSAQSGNDGFGLDLPQPKPTQEERQILKDWEYGPSDLLPELVRLLEERRGRNGQIGQIGGPSGDGIVLTFVEGSRATKLIEGEEYLDLAARAIATQPLQ